ncbi:MAG: cupredoxin domain-containing protein [Candidatus Kerfeldbacteria bacterium]|nr:cupredoxin domain-containing protein [Candidatus Kerfeldbacteria bacterium]
MNNKTLALVLIILVIVVGGFIAWYLLQNDESATTNLNNAVSTVANRQRPPESTVWIIDGNFSPSVITIRSGESVTWVNQDETARQVSSMAVGDSSAGSLFKSEELTTDESFTHTFDTAGTWSYYDELNPIKSGQVIVE